MTDQDNDRIIEAIYNDESEIMTETTPNPEQPTLTMPIAAIIPINGSPEGEPKIGLALIGDGSVRWITLNEEPADDKDM